MEKSRFQGNQEGFWGPAAEEILRRMRQPLIGNAKRQAW